jgi:hypothetical protein
MGQIRISSRAAVFDVCMRMSPRAKALWKSPLSCAQDVGLRTNLLRQLYHAIVFAVPALTSEIGRSILTSGGPHA